MRLNGSLFVALGAALGLALSVQSASAAVTNVDLASYYDGGVVYSSDDWTSAINGSAIAAALATGTGNAGTGITFSNPDGKFVEIDYGSALDIGSLSIGVTAHSVVNTLLNTFSGYPDLQAVVTFTNSNGYTADYQLVGDQTIREYNNDYNSNSLPGVGTGVSAQLWWGTSGVGSNGEPNQRLDVQSFVLPSAWAGTNLVGVKIEAAHSYYGFGTPVLSGLQVTTEGTSVVPEPATWALMILAFGLFGASLRSRRVRHA